jgi:hypothetical protein
MSGLDALIKAARKRMGPTKSARLKDAAERSRLFNLRAEVDYQAQQMTPEILARRCTL